MKYSIIFTLIVTTLMPLGAVTKKTASKSFFDYVNGCHRKKYELDTINRIELNKALEVLIHKKKSEFTVADICTIHRLIYGPTAPRNAGNFRKVRVYINGMTPPDYHQVPKLMQEFITWLRTARGNPVKLSAEAHLKLVDIHPFRDANGRTARTVLALLLLREGYPVPTFTIESRRFYSYAINHALKTGDMGPYMKLISRGIKKSFDTIKDKF